jgi:hypothetical protein
LSWHRVLTHDAFDCIVVEGIAFGDKDDVGNFGVGAASASYD